MGLWPIRLEEWEGFVFLNLDGQAPPLGEVVATQPDSPTELARYAVGDLRVGARREYDVAANWKIVVENYHECLHCPTVHPELVKIVPLYRSGEVEEEGQILGNSMGHGLTSFTASGLSTLPTLPGLDEVDEHTFYGVYLFPNLILNYHSETVNAVTIEPAPSDRTRVISEFLVPARDGRGRRLRPERGRRLPRPGGATGLAGLRARAARGVVAVLHRGSVPAAGEVDRGVQPPVP